METYQEQRDQEVRNLQTMPQGKQLKNQKNILLKKKVQKQLIKKAP